MRTRIPLLLLALLLPLAARAEEGRKPSRVLIPLEEYLPPDTLAFLSLPDGRTALEVLRRCGEDREALAARLAERGGTSASAVATQLELLAAAATGPVTFSLHREVVPRREPKIVFVASVATRERGHAYRETGMGFLRSVVLPLVGEKVRIEEIMGLPVTHVRGEEEVFYAATKGFLLCSSSALTLGRVLREMQSSTGATLRNRPGYRRARKLAGAEKGSGFLYVRDPSILRLPAELGLETVAGRLDREGGGFRDEVLLVPGEEGLLRRLDPGGTVPTAWIDAAGKGAWLGAALDPQGAGLLVLALLDPARAPGAAFIEDVARGPVEVLLRSGTAPLFRIPLREGVEAAEAAGPLGSRAVVEGGTLYVSESAEVLARRPAAGDRPWTAGGSAVLKAPLSVLLSLLGREGAPGARTTAWVCSVAEEGVRVSSGKAESGLFQAAVASLFR